MFQSSAKTVIKAGLVTRRTEPGTNYCEYSYNYYQGSLPSRVLIVVWLLPRPIAREACDQIKRFDIPSYYLLR